MTPQEAAYHEFMKPIRKLELVNEMEDQAFYNLFQAGVKWQSGQDNQALSSTLKEIAELTSWKNEMLQLWNKLDAYIETRKDIRLGESKVDFAIKIMKERDELHKSLESLSNSVVRSTTLMIYAEPEIEAEVDKARKLLST